MSTLTLRKLSQSTDGAAIKVAAIASSGTLIHTATAGTAAADDYDKIWLWAYNSHSVAVVLTLQFGGTTSPDNDIKKTLQPQTGLVAVLVGNILQNAKELRAYASVANVITLTGEVHRAAP